MGTIIVYPCVPGTIGTASQGGGAQHLTADPNVVAQYPQMLRLPLGLTSQVFV
jgi:hypothetical protein